MDLREAIYSRRSVREFSARAVQGQALRRLIDAAIQAPSAVNSQPWSFTVVQDRELLARISTHSKAHMLATPAREVSLHRLEAMLRDPGFDIFYGAPALIVISSVAADRWATENCALAAENLMLAAHAEGLGSCWIGFAQGWLGTPDGRAAIGVPPNYVPVAPLIVGYPKAPPPAVARKEPEVHWIG